MDINHLAGLVFTLIGAVGLIEASGFGYGFLWKISGK